MRTLFEDPKELDLITRVSFVLNEKGLKNMTMDDIASELHVSKKTLYKYVKNRAELVEKCIRLRVGAEIENREKIAILSLNAIEEQLKTIEYTSAIIAKTNDRLHYDLEKFFPNAWQVIVDFKKDYLLPSITKSIEKGKNEGLYCSRINAKIIATMYIAKIDLVFDGSTFPKGEFKFESVLQEITQHHLRGMATAEGIKELERLTGVKYR